MKPPTSPSPFSVELRCHPGSPCPAVRSLQARASLLEPGILAVGFTLQGDLDRLVLPAPASPAFADRLWEHTCFEAFVALEGEEAYRELNLSPSTAWAAYAFDRYREGQRRAEELAPRIVAHERAGRLEIHALAALGEDPRARKLRLGLTAVLEDRDGTLSYWAIHHTDGPPDFHRPEGFRLVLDPAEFVA